MRRAGTKNSQRIVEVGAERVAFAFALGFEPLRQAHEQRERHLDTREKQQPGGREQDEERPSCVARPPATGARMIRPAGNPARRRSRSSTRAISPRSVS